MRSLRSSAVSLAVAMSWSIPVAAPAQDMINNLPDYTGAWVMGDLMQRRGRDYGEEGSHDRPNKERAADPNGQSSEAKVSEAALLQHATYAPSADTGSEIESAFAAYLAGHGLEPSAPELLQAVAVDSPPGLPFARLLASGVGKDDGETMQALAQLQDDYAGWLSSLGYSARNLFDVHTAFMMHSWAIANGGVMISDSKAAFRAIRTKLIDIQMGEVSPRLLTRNDTQKQQEAQSFALLTALLVSAWSDADARQKTILRDGIEALGRRIGADFQQLELTSKGFEAR